MAASFEKGFHEIGLGDIETQPYNASFSGMRPEMGILHEFVVYMLYQKVQARDHLGLLKKLKATCPHTYGFGYQFGEYFVSIDLLFSIDDFYNLCEARPEILTEPQVVADLGAGWGRIGFVLMAANPKASYLIFDLPEVLLVSSYYLPKVRPECAHFQYPITREMKTLNKEHFRAQGGGCFYMGSHDFARLHEATVDAVINVASFQEMNRTQVAQYFEIITSKARGGVLYHKQRHDNGTPGMNYRPFYERGLPNVHEYPYPSTWENIFMRNSTYSSLYVEAAFRVS